ncbi:hypothetical protein HGG76_27410 [Ochrobactrum tritici]|uniref:Uncharacterized protein n=1 Tax=Brucella tritici TaxID=94626 RepID=A0A7X6FSX2_9HYPH|nr:hypothetical protein [Brucella tritici]
MAHISTYRVSHLHAINFRDFYDLAGIFLVGKYTINNVLNGAVTPLTG